MSHIFSVGDIGGIIVIVAVLLAMAAPIALSVGEGRLIPFILASILTVAAAAIVVVSRTPLDLILAVGIWMGGMISGLAGYLQGEIKKAARNHAYRLIHLDDDGLTRPDSSD